MKGIFEKMKRGKKMGKKKGK